MSHARKRLLGAAGMALVLAGSLFLNAPATAQSRSAHPQSRVKPAARRPTIYSGPRAIDAEEMQSLLKRNGERPLLVNYWATWCDPCRDEFPDLVKIDARYRPKGLDFIAISLDDLADLKTTVPKFLRAMKATMPVYLLNMSRPRAGHQRRGSANGAARCRRRFFTTKAARSFTNTLAASSRWNCAPRSKK